MSDVTSFLPTFMLFAIFGIIGLVFVGVWLYSLIHCIKNPDLDDTMRIIGIVLIVFLGLLGSLIYLFLPRHSPSSQRHHSSY